MLNALQEFDDLRKRIALAKNNLESYIYETRSHLRESEVVAKVSTEESRDKLISMLTDSEDWLYDQADDAEDPFVSKLNELRDVSDPIFYRAHEYEMRPKAVDEAERILNYTRGMLASFLIERPWIPEDERKTLTDKLDSLDKWLVNKTALQEKKQLTEMPAFRSEDILKKLKPIAKLAEEMIRRPKPKEKPKKKKTKKANATNDNATTVNVTVDNSTSANSTIDKIETDENLSEESKEEEKEEPTSTETEIADEDSENAPDTSDNPSHNEL